MTHLMILPYSDYKLKIIREKAFLVSQVLDKTKIEPTTSGLGLEGFRQLLSESKKSNEQLDSGKRKSGNLKTDNQM
jgi:hypothetical protein